MTTTFYRHWRDVPERVWRWPNFSPAEIACRGTGKLLVNEPALDKLQALRNRLGKPLIVRSAYRSPEHNRAVGGAKRSKHMESTAFDIAMSNHDPEAFEAAAREAGFLGFGFYRRSGFIHVDLGPARQWGERFPVRATAFAAETPPAREVLADKPHDEGWWRGRRGDAGRSRGRGRAERPGRDPDRRPAARAVSRHIALGVHRRGARGDRGHHLCPPRRLEAGAAMMDALLTGIAAAPRMRVALRYGVTVLAMFLFLLSLRRSGERAGRIVERLEITEKTNAIQRRMLEAAARRPRDPDELAGRLRDGRF